MARVVFVAPFLLPATVQFIEAAAGLSDVRMGLVTMDPAVKIPPSLAQRIATHRQVSDAFDPQQLAAAVRAMGPALGGPVDCLIGALEQLQVPLAEAREILGLPGMRAEAARNFRDKSRMKTALREAGLPCARHRLVTGEEEALEFAAEIGFPLVAKPPDGAGARGTYRVEDARSLREALGVLAASPSNPALLEEFVVGRESSFETVSIAGKPVWYSSTRYLPTPLEALENPWIQWCVLLPREREDPALEDIKKIAFRALEVLGMGTGISHMEWFRRRDGSIAISEVAARPAGAQITNLVSVAHECDLRAAWAHLMIFGEFSIPPRRWAAGAAFLRGMGQGRVKAVRGLRKAQEELGAMVVEAKLPQPGQPKSTSYEGEGHVVLRHAATEVVEKALMRLISLVRVEYS